MAFVPLQNRVLIEREEQASTTSTGIIIPDSAKEKPLQGKVIAVGNWAEKDGIKEGDTIVFTTYAGTEITLESKEYLILESKDILGIIKSEEA